MSDLLPSRRGCLPEHYSLAYLLAGWRGCQTQPGLHLLPPSGLRSGLRRQALFNEGL